jgi:hypothetical protein
MIPLTCHLSFLAEVLCPECSFVVGSKVTEEEYARLEKLAQAEGQTLSDWGREVLVNQIGDPAGHDVVLAEVMALRTIVINVMSALARGESVTREKIAGLIRHADKERFRRANEKWIDAANHCMGQSPSQAKNNGKPGKQ